MCTFAYFRAYQRPNRYWDVPDGLRYWRTMPMIAGGPASTAPSTALPRMPATSRRALATLFQATSDLVIERVDVFEPARKL